MIQRGDKLFAGPEYGVRGHRWYRWYHLIGVAWLGAALSIGAALTACWPGCLATAGLLALSWEAFEIGYCRARNGRWLPEYELVTIDLVSIRIDGWMIRFWHAVRAAAAVVLITIGG